MLTAEVVFLKHCEPPPERPALRRAFLAGLMLLLLAAAHLRPVYRVTVAGETLPGCYSLRQTERCAALARETAEEILESSAAMPVLHRSLRLRLGPADGDERLLTDALLRSVRGVTVSDEVIVNGTRLGTVADGFSLCRGLSRSIRGQMPNAAVSGHISGKLELRRVYTRAGQDTPERDMILLITGMAPVIYVDADGKLA